METSGDIELDDRPDEAFKVAALSSMRISEREWDAESAFIGTTRLELPNDMWILQPAEVATSFGLNSGTSEWQANTPTIEITLDQPRPITGWVTPTENPNDDNVSIWAASTEIERSWSSTVHARPPRID